MRAVSRIVTLGVGLAMAATLVPAEAYAQRRGGRAVPRVSRPIVVRPIVVRPIRYYRPYYSAFYASFGYSPFWWGYYGWAPYWGWGWAYPPPYYYPYYNRNWDLGEARLQVKPRDAEVYVNGYFAGLVDDFDGISQRLRLEPGEYEVEIFREGYKPYRQRLMFTRGNTIHIRHELEKQAPGDPPAVRPTPSSPPPSQPPSLGDRDRDYRAPRARGPRPARPLPSERAEAGTLALRVQPADAEILIDGERWNRPSGERLVVELAPGTHRVEVRKPGFDTYSTEVTIKAGQATSLNVSLLENGRQL